MCDPFSPRDLNNCHPQYLKVKGERPVFEIILVKFNLHRNRQFIPSIYLCPASDSRDEFVNTFAGSKLNQIILII